MSWRKDLKSKPKTGRFFPIRFEDAVYLVKEYGLFNFLDERIKIGNTEIENKYGYLIADIMPE